MEFLALFALLDYLAPAAAVPMGVDWARALAATLATGSLVYAAEVAGLPSIRGFTHAARAVARLRRVDRHGAVTAASVLVLGVVGAGLLVWLLGHRGLRVHATVLATFAALSSASLIAGSLLAVFRPLP